MDPEQFAALQAGYLTGELTPAQRHRLAAALATDENLRAAFLAELDLAADLQAALRTDESAITWQRTSELLALRRTSRRARTAERVAQGISQRRRLRRQRRQRRRSGVVLLSLAAAAAVALTVVLVGDEGTPAAAGRISIDFAHQVEVAGSALVSGATLPWNTTIAVGAAGLAELRLADGSQLTLAAGSRGRFHADGADVRLELDRGAVLAQVQPQGSGTLRLRSTLAEAVVVGTQLRFRAGADQSWLAVELGRVELRALAGGEVVAVGAGQQARVDAAGIGSVQELTLPMGVAAVQLRSETDRLAAHRAALLADIASAASAGAGLVVFPAVATEASGMEGPERTAVTPLHPEDPFLLALRGAARVQRIMVAIGCYWRASDGTVSNRALLIDTDGALRAMYDKDALSKTESRAGMVSGSVFTSSDTAIGRVALLISKDVYAGDDRWGAAFDDPAVDLLLVLNSDRNTERYVDTLSEFAAGRELAVVAVNWSWEDVATPGSSFVIRRDGTVGWLPLDGRLHRLPDLLHR